MGRFDPVPISVAAVRRYVARTLEAWALTDVLDDAVLCASELASNAVLHGRGPFEVSVHRHGDGVRVEVCDPRPDELPFMVPTRGRARAITATAGTGRGLQIVASHASRWGFRATDRSKCVWFETRPGQPPRTLADAAAPEVEVDQAPAGAKGVRMRLRSLPVVEAVESGMHVDELVRHVQLGGFTDLLDAAALERFHELLDRTGPARLAGRHAALLAAADNAERFDVDVVVPEAAVLTLSELNAMLDHLSAVAAMSTGALRDEVRIFRAWVAEEVAAQVAGRAPVPCPLP